MKYIKLTDEAISSIAEHYSESKYSLGDPMFWFQFATAYPPHIVESIPTDTKERDELLRMAERFKVAALIGNLTRSAQDCVDIAVAMRNAVNKACETKEDKA